MKERRSRRKKITLNRKLIKIFVLMAIVSLTLLYGLLRFLVHREFKSYIAKEQEHVREILVSKVEAVVQDGVQKGDESRIEEIGKEALNAGMILQVELQDPYFLWCMHCKEYQSCHDMLAGMKEQMEAFSIRFNGSYAEYAVELYNEETAYGKVIFGYYGPYYYEEQDLTFLHMMDRMFLAGLFLLLAAAAAFAVMLAKRMAKPLEKMAEHIEEMEKGNYQEILATDSQIKEMDQMAYSLNRLGRTLTRQEQFRIRLIKDYAHELRTPLSSIQISLEAMIDGIWEMNEERLVSCHEEIMRLTRMLAKMDELAKIEEEKQELHYEKFDVKELAKNLILTMESKAAAKKQTIRCSNSPVFLNADKDKVGQVIVNLLSNATRYTKEGGEIEVRIEEKEDNVVISVHDNGIGISEKALPHIFEHLYQADQSRTGNAKGHGIGLAVVKAIVEAHKGSVKAVSIYGKGSSFYVILPKCEEK